MRPRDYLFGVVAAALLVTYLMLGSRISPVLLPGGTITPTPPRPTAAVSAPRVPGTIAFSLRGDVYVLRDGSYINVTSEGRNLTPNLSADGRTLIFSRTETIDGKRTIDGQTAPALLHYTDIIRKGATGGTETIVLTGLKQKSASGFHQVAYHDDPALSPDGSKIAVVTDRGDGNGSNLEIYDANGTSGAAKLLNTLSSGSDLADPSWSPDGKTIAVTSYTLGVPRILLVPTDGRAATPQKMSVDGEPYRPQFSPDGRLLIYTLRGPKGGNDVHVVEMSTGRDIALTSDGKSWNGVFSPDASQVAFLREQNGVIDLYSMELGTALTQAVPPKAPVKLTRGEGIDGDSRPSWGR